MQRILITGVVGSHLAEPALAEGLDVYGSTGWRSPFEEGLRKTIDWYQRSREVRPSIS